MPEYISIRGARVHNLRNISLDIPRNKLVVLTGLSGSGKSSLAFDTLYAEGQRRYGVFTPIRELFAATEAARVRGYRAGEIFFQLERRAL